MSAIVEPNTCPLTQDLITVTVYQYVQGNPYGYIDPWGLDWVYSQSTGSIVHFNQSFQNPPTLGQSTPGASSPDYLGSGYSGTNMTKSQCTCGLNNPGMQNVPFIGPIPQGLWTIGPQQLNRTAGGKRLPGSMRLTPNDANTFGRTGFLIHGDNGKGNNSASEGCIIARPSVRNTIGNSGDNRLWVAQ